MKNSKKAQSVKQHKIMQKKRSDQKLSFKTNCVKKTCAFKSAQNAFKTVRDYVTCCVKRRDFQDLKWHDFVFSQGKALQGVKKGSDWKKPFQSSFFLRNGQHQVFENGLEKTNLEGYQVYVHTHTYIYISISPFVAIVICRPECQLSDYVISLLHIIRVNKTNNVNSQSAGEWLLSISPWYELCCTCLWLQRHGPLLNSASRTMVWSMLTGKPNSSHSGDSS